MLRNIIYTTRFFPALPVWCSLRTFTFFWRKENDWKVLLKNRSCEFYFIWLVEVYVTPKKQGVATQATLCLVRHCLAPREKGQNLGLRLALVECLWETSLPASSETRTSFIPWRHGKQTQLSIHLFGTTDEKGLPHPSPEGHVDSPIAPALECVHPLEKIRRFYARFLASVRQMWKEYSNTICYEFQ